MFNPFNNSEVGGGKEPSQASLDAFNSPPDALAKATQGAIPSGAIRVVAGKKAFPGNNTQALNARTAPFQAAPVKSEQSFQGGVQIRTR